MTATGNLFGCTYSSNEYVYWKVVVPSAKGTVTGHAAARGVIGGHLEGHILVKSPTNVYVDSSSFRRPSQLVYDADWNLGSASAGTNDLVIIEFRDKPASTNQEVAYVATVEANY